MRIFLNETMSYEYVNQAYHLCVFWSYFHRNRLGLAFWSRGNLSAPSLFMLSFGWRNKWMWDGCAVCVCARRSTCAQAWSPSAAEHEGSCVISHSSALTSSINSSQILITCFQDVTLPLWPISAHSARLQTADRKQRLRKHAVKADVPWVPFPLVSAAAPSVCWGKENQMWLKNWCIITSPGVKEFAACFFSPGCIWGA